MLRVACFVLAQCMWTWARPCQLTCLLVSVCSSTVPPTALLFQSWLTPCRRHLQRTCACWHEHRAMRRVPHHCLLKPWPPQTLSMLGSRYALISCSRTLLLMTQATNDLSHSDHLLQHCCKGAVSVAERAQVAFLQATLEAWTRACQCRCAGHSSPEQASLFDPGTDAASSCSHLSLTLTLEQMQLLLVLTCLDDVFAQGLARLSMLILTLGWAWPRSPSGGAMTALCMQRMWMRLSTLDNLVL